jgi:hypothetical protein
VYPPVLLIYFISAAVILLASLALIVQVSLPYNKIGRREIHETENTLLEYGILLPVCWQCSSSTVVPRL